MKLFLKLRKPNEGSAYDLNMDISSIEHLPIPSKGERFFFYYYDTPMFMIVNDRTFEIIYGEEEIEYHITLWGSYYLNIEGQRGEEI